MAWAAAEAPLLLLLQQAAAAEAAADPAAAKDFKEMRPFGVSRNNTELGFRV